MERAGGEGRRKGYKRSCRSPCYYCCWVVIGEVAEKHDSDLLFVKHSALAFLVASFAVRSRFYTLFLPRRRRGEYVALRMPFNPHTWHAFESKVWGSLETCQSDT